MKKLVRVLFTFESEYSGDPRYISGNALRHALGMQLNTSNGIFTDKTRLEMPESYEEYFHIRTERSFLRPHFDGFWDRKEQKQRFRCILFPSQVAFDLINPPTKIIEIIKSKELLSFGGKRNCGFGRVSLCDYIEIDIERLKLPDLGSHITLLAPIIYLPSFVDRFNCRHEEVRLWNHTRSNTVRVVSEGQFFRIKAGRNISRLAREGILRRVLFGKFGFGEFQVHDWTND